jgi:hypothetical protein
MQNPQGQGNIFHFVSVIIAVSLQIFFARVAKKFSWKKAKPKVQGGNRAVVHFLQIVLQKQNRDVRKEKNIQKQNFPPFILLPNISSTYLFFKKNRIVTRKNVPTL